MTAPDDQLLAALTDVVARDPGNLAVQLHLAELLLDAGRSTDALPHVAAVLQADPTNRGALVLMGRAVAAGPGAPDVAGDLDVDGDALAGLAAAVDEVLPPRFVDGDIEICPDGEPGDDDPDAIEQVGFGLDEVGGMDDVKRRLELSFLGPLRNPELRALYRKNLRGGLLLYGPPGCGKTHIARALAGEMGGRFVSISIADVLSMWTGRAEQNLHAIFGRARRHRPCVVFIDELDALGHRRSQIGGTGLRTLSNQLLTELDGVDDVNDGVFVLGATNAPWDVDVALRRPGRFDRMMFVPPPDREARKVILELHLRERPVEGVDLGRLADASEHCSGADLAHVCELAAERALADSIATGDVRMIDMGDLLAAMGETRPSTLAWFATARNVAMFANASGDYDDLAEHLKVTGLG